MPVLLDYNIALSVLAVPNSSFETMAAFSPPPPANRSSPELESNKPH